MIIKKPVTSKEMRYKMALVMIVKHFESCMVDEVPDDGSIAWILRKACDALGWKVLKSPNGEVHIDKTGEY